MQVYNTRGSHGLSIDSMARMVESIDFNAEKVTENIRRKDV